MARSVQAVSPAVAAVREGVVVLVVVVALEAEEAALPAAVSARSAAAPVSAPGGEWA